MADEDRTQDNIQQESSFKEECFALRADIEDLKEHVKLIKSHRDFENEQTFAEQHSEMKANIMLAYRHLEDARMRLGKAIQAYDGGKSILPR